MIFGGLDAEKYDRVYGDRVLLGRILRYFGPARRLMLVVAGLVVGSSLLDATIPLAVAHGVDELTKSRTLSGAGLLVGIILAAGVLSWICNFVRQWFTARAVGDVVMQLRVDAFDAVLRHDLSFYDEYASGRIVSRVTSDSQDFSNVVTLTVQLMSQVLLMLIFVGVLLRIDARLTLLALTITPFVATTTLIFRHFARIMSQRAQRALAKVNSTIQEVITGITVAKNFRKEGALYDEFRATNEQRYQVTLREGLLYNGIFPVLVFFAGLGTIIVVFVGGNAVLDRAIDAGSWYLFIQAIWIFWNPMIGIASFWSQFQLGLAASERVFALIDAEPRVRQYAGLPVDQVAGRIEFKHLSFRYSEQEQVLDDFSLTIKPGEMVAIVGHTGAGKSTLGKLVARFYEYQSGDLLIDGRDIRSFDLSSYRRRLGVVGQVPFLFAGTVLDNIRYSRPEASDDEVRMAAMRVGGGDWIDALPDGLGTDCGEMGRSLSLGQRQLVALARLLLQHPSIIILDEATASVDPLTEAQIQEGMDLVLRGSTAIVIAHRLSTVREADRIIVLDRGSVVEEGTHDSLLRRGGHYGHLYNTYFRHQSPDYQPGGGFVPVAAGA